MATADGLTLPKPAIPKTLGILNVIFAVIMILWGTCTGLGAILGPQIQKFGQGVVEKAKKDAEARKTADLKALDEREQAATTDAEKTAIAQERAAVNNRPAPPTITIAASPDLFADPTTQIFLVAQVLTGLLLNITMLVAGVGLIRLTAWGRTLDLWWAGLQIVQLLIFAVASFAVVQPAQAQANQQALAEIKQQMAGPNAPPNAAFTAQMMETMIKLMPVFAVLTLAAGLTYPILSLILLRTAGARAACLGPPTKSDLSTDL